MTENKKMCGSGGGVLPSLDGFRRCLRMGMRCLVPMESIKMVVAIIMEGDYINFS